MKKITPYLRATAIMAVISLFAVTVYAAGDGSTKSQETDFSSIRLKHQIIPLSNSVYKLLEYHEALGNIDFLPQAKPYSRIYILKALQNLLSKERITPTQSKIIKRYIMDLSRSSTGLRIYSDSTQNGFGVLGFAADVEARGGVGDNGAVSVSLAAMPYIGGDIGQNITLFASTGPVLENLAPDMFYESYTKGGKVNFKHSDRGYVHLPYRYNYESMYKHTTLSDKNTGNGDITEDMAASFIYFTELNASFFNGALEFSINNQRRAWGPDNQNLVLSESARRMPGFEIKLAPLKWMRYSLLTSSLNSTASHTNNYLKEIYGHDVGIVQNLFTLHMLEITPWRWFQISATAGNVWAKRFEPAYLIPFVFSHFSELESGDYDNLTMSVDLSFKIPKFGKLWFSFFNDEFSFGEDAPLLKIPRNRYAWQLGIKTPFRLIPNTLSSFKYTRVTPFVYTHYPETRLSIYEGRALDMTYRNDGFNLGFHLPPNSGEFNWILSNMSIKNLALTLDSRYTIHGTNDLDSPNKYQIYGDIYRYQDPGPQNDIMQYPLLDFTKDGIYDYTVSSLLTADYRFRGLSRYIGYFRLKGSVGFSRTWWRANSSGVAEPDPVNLFTLSAGLVIDL